MLKHVGKLQIPFTPPTTKKTIRASLKFEIDTE